MVLMWRRLLVPRAPSLYHKISTSASNHVSCVAIEGLRREGRSNKAEKWGSLLRQSVNFKTYRHSAPGSRTSRVSKLLNSSTRFDSLVKSQTKISENPAEGLLRKAVDFDDLETSLPPEAIALYKLVLNGKEQDAWNMFEEIVKKGEQGEPSASIWHWYIMIGMIARDSTVSIRDVFKMACFSGSYRSSIIWRSLKDPDELGGVSGQKRVLTFALMHNLKKRMTREAFEAVLAVWNKFLERRTTPSSRHINALCATLIHMKRPDEALKELSKWIKPASAGSDEEDTYGWATKGGAQMSQYTVGIIMFSFLSEGLPLRAFEMFKTSISDQYKVSPHCVSLSLLLWAGRQAYEGVAACEGNSDEQLEHTESGELLHWKSQVLWDGHPSAVQARHIFLSQLHLHYPDLANVKNPLYETRDGDETGFLWKTHARMQRWTDNFNSVVAPYVRWVSTNDDAELLHVPDSLEEGVTKMHLDEITFHNYLELLPCVSLFEEVPWEDYIVVLAWMKQLNISPTRFSLMRICWAIDHLIPPAADSFQSCAGPLHDYLAEWIGEENIPDRSEVAAFIKHRRI